MTDSPHQPRKYDAVLGGENLLRVDTAVLGGIEGVKHRLASKNMRVRFAGLQDALKYGDAGLDIIIAALADPSSDIQGIAYLLLRRRVEAKVHLALSDRSGLFQNQWNTLKHSGWVNSIAISPHGDYIVSGSGDRTIKIWDFYTGECLHTLKGHSNSVSSVVISCDGDLIVSSSRDRTIKVWNTHTGECLNTLTGHSEWISSVAVSCDGNYIVSGSGDRTIKVWNTHTGECLNTLIGHSYSVLSVVISDNGDRIISGSSDVKVRCAALQDALKYGDAGLDLVIDALGDPSLDIQTKAYLLLRPREEAKVKLALSNCDRWKFFENIGTLQQHSSWVQSVAISPDGSYIVSGSNDNTIKIWGIPES